MNFFQSITTLVAIVRYLGILADGNVVPCCLAYDESISLGKVNENDLQIF